jgi:hypothetical protein
MICHSCHSQNIRGTIFCLNCGISLLQHDRSRDTTGLGAKPAARSVQERALRVEPPEPSSERRFSATVLNSGRRLDLPLSTPLLIGRQDAARGHYPEIDLNHDGGYDSGVSRRHARIALVDAATYVEDLDSANGSFLNDQRLEPRTSYRLQPGDELRLGSLILRIEKV